MFLNLIIFLLVSWVMYRWLIKPIRWRVGRIFLYVPILVMVVFGILLGTAIGEIQDAPTAEEIAELIVDSQTVQRGDLVVAVSASGSIQPLRQVPMTFFSSGRVNAINFQAGERVSVGDVIATLDTSDFEAVIASAQIAFDVQQTAYDALIEPAREVDIGAAQVALDVAQAQYYAAVSTGPTAQQEEIARLQFELAKNRNYQLNLQRDAIVIPSGDVNSGLSVFPSVNGADFPAVPSDAIDFINQQIDTLNVQIATGVDSITRASIEQQIAALEIQKQQLNDSLDDAATSAAIAGANYEATVARGADPGSVAAANASLLQAQIALDRVMNGTSTSDLEQANLSLQLAQNALEQAQQTLSNAQIVAPIDGVIAQNNLTMGELPPQGIAVLVMDNSGYIVDLPIDETDVVKIQIGQKVEFEVDALPEAQLTGTVTKIAYTPVRIGQLVTYTVRVALDPTTEPIRVAMSVTARIITKEQPNVLTLGNRFIRIDNISQNAFVTVQNADGTFSETMVILGERNDTESVIVSGLSAGQEVVLLPRGTEGVEGLFN
jgi:HlyD family secretion protein